MIDEFADKAAEKLVPMVYRDAVRPAAAEIGRTLGGVVRTVLSPINIVVLTVDEVVEQVSAAIEQKLAARRVPPERVVAPRPEIAAPVLGALRFPGRDETLREMYVRLLATAMDSSTSGDAHPAYAQLIGELTPDEARVLSLFASDSSVPNRFPTVSLIAQMADGEFPVFYHFSTLGTEAGNKDELPRGALENLERLGIVRLYEARSMANKKLYERLEAHPVIQSALTSPLGIPETQLKLRRGQVEVTDFGAALANMCTRDTEYGKDSSS